MNPSTATSIDVSGVRKAFEGTDVLRDVSAAVEPGTVVALLGPSGCGKTTLLRTVAGLERLDGGEIRIGDRTVSGPGVHVPPERRRVGMVFQDWALFPHLSVAQNVAYGLPRSERRGTRVDRALEMVGLTRLGERRPSTLSGGQQQRVALARALAPQPRVLLLDEPFSNLDTVLRVQVRSEVHELLSELEVTTVFVTHDQEEAFVLGDQVAVMHRGRIVQKASPAQLYARPATPWVAGFVGDANLVAGQARGEDALTPVGQVPLETPAQGSVQVMLRPEELRLEPLPAGGGVEATVELQEYYGHDTVYVLRVDSGQEVVRARAWSVPQFGRGDRVAVSYAGRPVLAYRQGIEGAEDDSAGDAGPVEDTDPGGAPSGGGVTAKAAAAAGAVTSGTGVTGAGVHPR